VAWKGHAAKTCKLCGREYDEAGHLSARYKCLECSMRRFNSNWQQLHAHSGPYFDHWRRRVAASVGAMLVDEAEAER
jgi:predicted  nucleic acid-binding Zn-ribbon protein